MPKTHLLVVTWLSIASSAFGQTYDTPDAAAADPDFSVQGEYTKDGGGLQVVALGDGEFFIKVFKGGLPGAGWDGQKPTEIEGETDDVIDIAEDYTRVVRKSPTLGAKPPGDAVVLFDGTEESMQTHWKKGARITDDGLLKEGVTSTDVFQDFRLHAEFRTPFQPKARGQGRGNSGLYYQGRFETQILDSFGLKGEDNETGGIYKIKKPDLNMCLPPLTWQTYDAVFTAARYKEKKKISNARLTVKLNGIMIHNDVELPNRTTASPVPEGPDAGPIYLQNHGNPVRFKNIWVQPIDADKEARRPIIPGFERFHASGNKHSSLAAKTLITQLNCTSCHDTADTAFAGDLKWATKQAPILTAVSERVKADHIYRFLQNPHEVKPGTTMPEVLNGLPEADRASAAAALASYLASSGTVPNQPYNQNWANNGNRLYHEVGCIACHPSRRKASPVGTTTSVPFGQLGAKYTTASLQTFLKNPEAVRPSGHMPGFGLTDNELRDLSHFLVGDAGGAAAIPNTKYSLFNAGFANIADIDKQTPTASGTAAGLDLSISESRDNFSIKFEAFWVARESGEYQFKLGSDDSSRLFIDDEELIVLNGIHPYVTQHKTIKLSAGVHKLRVDYSEFSGQEALTLTARGPGMPEKDIGSSLTLNEDGSPMKPPRLLNQSGNLAPFYTDNRLVEEGRKLFAKLNCVRCHTMKDELLACLLYTSPSPRDS